MSGTTDLHGLVAGPTAEAGAQRAISAHLLAGLVELMPDAVLVADAAGRIVVANSHAAQLFG